jgi:tetratricopeptide (TPR) repeat protein
MHTTPGRITLLAVFSISLSTHIAAADALQDCNGPAAQEIRMRACSRVISEATWNNAQKAIAYTNRAKARIDVGAFKAAITDASEAIRLDNTKADGFAIRARAQLYLRETSLAIADYSEAIKRSSNVADFYV